MQTATQSIIDFHTHAFPDALAPRAVAQLTINAAASGYTLEATPYESAFAGYKDWFIQNFRRPGYTIEAGRGENPLPISQFREIYSDCLPILLIAATDS